MSDKAVYALSLQQPYAWILLQRAYQDNPKTPLKPVENRPRPWPSTIKFPQRVYIHASLTMYDVTLEEIRGLMLHSQWFRCKEYLISLYNLWELYKNDKKRLQQLGLFGCILGSTTFTGQVTESENRWFFGPYAYTHECPEMLPKPVPCKGALGFWTDLPDITTQCVVKA
jgi:hypothetical protein